MRLTVDAHRPSALELEAPSGQTVALDPGRPDPDLTGPGAIEVHDFTVLTRGRFTRRSTPAAP